MCACFLLELNDIMQGSVATRRLARGRAAHDNKIHYLCPELRPLRVLSKVQYNGRYHLMCQIIFSLINFNLTFLFLFFFNFVFLSKYLPNSFKNDCEFVGVLCPTFVDLYLPTYLCRSVPIPKDLNLCLYLPR